MKLATTIQEKCMRPIAIAATLFVALAALPASAPRAAAAVAAGDNDAQFYCFWVDSRHNRYATTPLFAGQVAQAEDITRRFAQAMRARDDGKGRVYDCGYARDARKAAQDRHRLSAVHQTRGFEVVALAWTDDAN